jgi:hypothetical protein
VNAPAALYREQLPIHIHKEEEIGEVPEATPHFPPLIVLLILGTVPLIGISLFEFLHGPVQKSSRLASIGGVSVLVIASGYSIVLCGFSFFSREIVLPAGSWNHFCEIDCHLAYSIAGAQTSGTLGPETEQARARGNFVVVRVKTWFDPSTISLHRGDSSLTPNSRRVVLADDAGHYYSTPPKK